MNLQLAATSSMAAECSGLQCKIDQGFDLQVKRLGARLADSAYASHPDLKARVPAFRFFVAEKNEMGTASDANGTVIVFRGVYQPGSDEAALAFVIAREMGHVIARHHDEKSAATVVASVLVRLLMPVTNLAGGVALLAGTAASTVGAKALADGDASEKTREATTIAFDLLERQGWPPGEVAESLRDYATALPAGGWQRSIDGSRTAMTAGKPGPVLLALDP